MDKENLKKLNNLIHQIQDGELIAILENIEFNGNLENKFMVKLEIELKENQVNFLNGLFSNLNTKRID